MKRKVFTSVTDSRNDFMKLCKDVQDFNEVLVPKTVKTSEQDQRLVQVDDIVLHQKNLRCLTQESENPEDNWLDDDVRARQHKKFRFVTFPFAHKN